jgi:hypothetical protein
MGNNLNSNIDLREKSIFFCGAVILSKYIYNISASVDLNVNISVK